MSSDHIFYLCISAFSVLYLLLFDKFLNPIMPEWYKEFMTDRWNRYSDPYTSESRSLRWVLSTTVVSLSPFLFTFIPLIYIGGDYPAYLVRAIKAGSIMYAAIAISSSSYLDLLYGSGKVYDLISHSRKVFTHIWFLILAGITLALYVPLHFVEFEAGSFHYFVSFVLILGSMFFSLKTKTMVLESEEQLLHHN